MRMFLVALATSAVMSGITAAAILLTVDDDGDSGAVTSAPAAVVEEGESSGATAGSDADDSAAGAAAGADSGGLVETASGSASRADSDGLARTVSGTADGETTGADGETVSESAPDAGVGVGAFSPSEVFDAAAHSVVAIRTDFGGGSGFFVDGEGHVVTNLHVVEDAGRISVTTYAGETVPADLAGSDWGNDLALLRVDADGLTFEPAVLGDGSELDVGHEVAAIGAPGERLHSLSTGVVSGLERSRLRDGRMAHHLIQSDAAINPGSSGGVLVNGEGEVIGVTSLINSPVSGFTGIGFSVSVETLKRVLPRMVDGEEISHPRLGVVLSSEDGELRVAGLSAGDAAEDAGVEEGDAILSLGGEAVAGFGDLVAALESLRSGEDAVIVVEREGERIELEIELREWERVRARDQRSPFFFR